jgi:hypothetical protein
MGRQLSEVQRDILRRAYRSREAMPERMRQRFQKQLESWKVRKAWFAERGLEAPARPPDPDDPDAPVPLQPDITGRDVIRALADSGRLLVGVRAAAGRVVARLIRRGLLSRSGQDGLRLTAEGLARAREL